MKESDIRSLEEKARQFRKEILETIAEAGSGHPGGSLSAVEIFLALYYYKLNHKPDAPDWTDRDRFIMSKGHASPVTYVTLADCGYFPKDELKEFNHFKSSFGMHLDSKKVKGVDVSTGSLGHGLPMGVGLALGARIQKKSWTTYCILGDGECNEGSVWEAAMAASHFKLNNLITIVDRNNDFEKKVE